jgi:general secretion pathway protein E
LKPPKSENIRDEAIDPSVIKFINQVLSDAIKQRATDIHFEPFEDDLRVRYRIDGVLYEVPCPPTIKHFQASIASRIKVMADLDIAEKRRPQDGRIDVKMDNEVYDLRVSIMPTPFGESIGIRLLPRSSPIVGLDGLGLSRSELDILEKAIEKPYGIILVTGPTGSGKTTTLYSCLSKINSPQRKILTIEDPIEYQLKGITQMQVEPKIGFSFANALRSMLRHDPDVMMVGEIRDMETAELAVRTSLTGHLVFSTLHTNDAAGGITRLLDMNIDSFLVSSSVVLIIAQRLVRMICPHCKVVYKPEPQLLRAFEADTGAATAVYHGKGCEACRMTGFQGRTGIFEMLIISDEIRELILKKTPSHLIKQKAVSLGMKVLRQSGWEKIKQGATTIEEVLRVTQEEEA